MMPDVNPYEPPPLPWPLRVVDRLFSRLARRETRLTQAYVDEPHLLRGMFLRGVAALVVAIALIVAINYFPSSSFYFTLCSVSIAWLLGNSALRHLRNAQAYRNGWLDGRMQMISALSESMNRGMSPDEWIEGEMERDREVLRWF